MKQSQKDLNVGARPSNSFATNHQSVNLAGVRALLKQRMLIASIKAKMNFFNMNLLTVLRWAIDLRNMVKCSFPAQKIWIEAKRQVKNTLQDLLLTVVCLAEAIEIISSQRTSALLVFGPIVTAQRIPLRLKTLRGPSVRRVNRI